VPGNETARLDQRRRRQRVAREHRTRAEREAVAHAVGLMHDLGPEREHLFADPDPVPDLQPQPRDEIGLRDDAIDAIAPCKRIRERHRRLKLHRAIERIEAVDRLDLDEALLVAGKAPRHGAHLRRPRDGVSFRQRRIFRRARLAMDEPHIDVAAEDFLPALGEPARQRRRDRADARDRGDAECKAGDENAETREAFREGRPKLAGREAEGEARHAASIFSTRPSFSRTTLPQRAARLSSCVMRTSVVPLRA